MDEIFCLIAEDDFNICLWSVCMGAGRCSLSFLLFLVLMFLKCLVILKVMFLFVFEKRHAPVCGGRLWRHELGRGRPVRASGQSAQRGWLEALIQGASHCAQSSCSPCKLVISLNSSSSNPSLKSCFTTKERPNCRRENPWGWQQGDTPEFRLILCFTAFTAQVKHIPSAPLTLIRAISRQSGRQNSKMAPTPPLPAVQ